MEQATDLDLSALKLGELIDLRADAYAEVKKHEASLKELKAKVDELDERIMAALEDAGTDAARGKKATMSIKEVTVPVVKNWDELYAFITKSNYFQLLNRAPNAAAFRELFERGDSIPGVEPFTKRSLHFKSI